MFIAGGVDPECYADQQREHHRREQRYRRHRSPS
jgi:hypothetical protein